MPAGIEGELEPLREMIKEAVAEQSEELMDKYFSGEEFTLPEMYSALREGVAEGDIVPVLCGSAYHNLGIPSLLNAISAYFRLLMQKGLYNSQEKKTAVNPV